MTLEGKITIALLVVLGGGGPFAYCDLNDRLNQTRWLASSNTCSVDGSGQAALSLLRASVPAEFASHSYFERLLEALVRHAGLPLAVAREDLKKDLPGGLPQGWRWLEPWEQNAPVPPAPATPAPTKP